MPAALLKVEKQERLAQIAALEAELSRAKDAMTSLQNEVENAAKDMESVVKEREEVKREAERALEEKGRAVEAAEAKAAALRGEMQALTQKQEVKNMIVILILSLALLGGADEDSGGKFAAEGV